MDGKAAARLQTLHSLCLGELEKRQLLRPRDLDALNISREYLNKLYTEGVFDRPSRGLYVLPDSEPTEHRTIVEACKLVPKGEASPQPPSLVGRTFGSDPFLSPKSLARLSRSTDSR